MFVVIFGLLGFLFLVLFGAFGRDERDGMTGGCKAAAMRALNGDEP